MYILQHIIINLGQKRRRGERRRGAEGQDEIMLFYHLDLHHSLSHSGVQRSPLPDVPSSGDRMQTYGRRRVSKHRHDSKHGTVKTMQTDVIWTFIQIYILIIFTCGAYVTRGKTNNRNVFTAEPCVSSVCFHRRHLVLMISWLSVGNVVWPQAMHDKTREGTCLSAYACLCLCVCVVRMSAIVSHSLEVAAEIKENDKKVFT